MRKFVWRSWISIFFRDKSSDETTSPRETDALFVYRNPPPRRPIDACPAYTNAAPSFSPRPNRSWIVSGGSSTVSLIPTETSRGFRSGFRPAFRTNVDPAPSARITRFDATWSFGATETPRTRPRSRQRSSTRIPVTSIPGVLGFLRQPRVELRAERGEAGPAPLGELRRIERDREGCVLGQKGEILPDDEPLNGAVLRPLREQIDQGPRIDAPPEHPLHPGSPAALDEKGREALAGEGQRGRGARGPGSHHDDIKTLHALPVPLRKSGTGKRLSAGSRHRHRLQLELAPLVALRGARELFAEKLLPDEEAADPGHPTGEEVAHRLLRGAVRLGDRAVVSRHREPTSIRVEVDDLRPPPSGERGRVDDSLRAVHRQREGDSARQRAEEFQTGIRAPLAGQIQDPFGGSAHRLFELPLDAHDDLGAEDETRLVRETQDPGFRIGMEGRTARSSPASCG